VVLRQRLRGQVPPPALLRSPATQLHVAVSRGRGGSERVDRGQERGHPLPRGTGGRRGDHELPDLDAIIAHVTQSVGTPEFGKPRLPPGHDEIRFTPQESLELLWQPFVASLLQALEVPAADWPLACGLAIQELMAQGKNVLAPHLAATIVMECAVPMSKIVIKN